MKFIASRVFTLMPRTFPTLLSYEPSSSSISSNDLPPLSRSRSTPSCRDQNNDSVEETTVVGEKTALEHSTIQHNDHLKDRSQQCQGHQALVKTCVGRVPKVSGAFAMHKGNQGKSEILVFHPS